MHWGDLFTVFVLLLLHILHRNAALIELAACGRASPYIGACSLVMTGV